MLFCKNDCNKFVTVGKKLETKTFKSVTKFFKAQFTTNKNVGMLKCMELKRIKKHAHLKLKNKLCYKIFAREDERRAYWVKCKIASHNAQCCSYNNHEEQCWYINCNHDRNHAYDKEREAVKCPHIKRPSYCNRKETITTISLKC